MHKKPASARILLTADAFAGFIVALLLLVAFGMYAANAPQKTAAYDRDTLAQDRREYLLHREGLGRTEKGKTVSREFIRRIESGNIERELAAEISVKELHAWMAEHPDEVRKLNEGLGPAQK